ncbi:hypothetical protein HPB48_001275 [Haemaphysalis longicornis]|uniref:Uncharacterized protein n=1 Tax=Haemaphysalis longicornis TaxID=44386 RepID=A0A9J6FKW1_HAELO|nr:hypothetical protein HPB48_001275 [Haemaphysalis longicornis]
MERAEASCLDLQSLAQHGGGHGSLPAVGFSTYSSKTISVANSSSNHSVHDASSDDGSGPISPRIQHSSLRHPGAYHEDRSSGTSLVIVDPLEGSPETSQRGKRGCQRWDYRDLHTDPSFMSTTQPLHGQLGHQSSKQAASWMNGHSPMTPSSAPSAGHADVLNLTPEGSPTSYVLGRPSMGCISPQPPQSAIGRRFALAEDKDARHDQCLVKPENSVYEPAAHDIADGANFCRRQQQAQNLMSLQGNCITEAATSAAALAASRLPVHSSYITSGDKIEKVTGKLGSPHVQATGLAAGNSGACMSTSTAFKPVSKRPSTGCARSGASCVGRSRNSFEQCQLNHVSSSHRTPTDTVKMRARKEVGSPRRA